MSEIRKRRVGTTLACQISVITNGQELPLEGRDITVLLVNPLGVCMRTNATFSGNVATFVYEGNEQQYTGVYRVEVYENFENVSQTVFDKDAFELVARSYMEEDGVDDLSSPLISLSGSIELAGKDGKSAYEIAVEQGFVGDVDAWLESLKPVKGVDYFTAEDKQSIVEETAQAVVTTIAPVFDEKQDVIDDLDAIREGAEAGGTAYQKPSGGIPKSDLSTSVQTSLGKADTALQEHQDISGKQDVINDLDAIRSGAAKGNTALQNHQDISGKVDKVQNATANDVAILDANGNLVDSGKTLTAEGIGALPSTTKYAGSQSVGGAANKAVSLPIATVDSSSVSNAINATVDGITELRNGVFCYLRNNVVNTVGGFTLNVNGLGAKYVYSSISDTAKISNQFSKTTSMLFIYNETRIEGGCWDMFFGVDTDLNDTAYKFRAINAGRVAYNTIKANILILSKDSKYVIAVNESGSTGTNKTLTTESFDPFGQIWNYSNGTIDIAPEGRVPNGYLWCQVGQHDARRSFNISTNEFEISKDVYLVAVPQSDGTAKLHSSPITQTLPSTEDSLIYIYLGIANATYQFDLFLKHPIYYFKDGALRLWTNQGTTAQKLGNTTIGGTTQGIFLNQGVPTACEDFEMQYVRYIAAQYGATRDDATGLWSYYYTKCARWDDTNEQIVWDRHIGYDDITDDEMKDMVKCRLHALQGVYGVGSKLSSRIALAFTGYGNNQGSTSPQAYINNYQGKLKTYGYIGVWGGASGGQYYSTVIGSEFQLLSGLRHYIGRSGNSSDQTLPNVCVNLEYITIAFGKNNQNINLAASPNLKFVSIMYTLTDNGGKNYTGCALILHPDVYAKIFDSTNADYTLWHKIDVANQARTNPITIQSA